MVLSGKRFIALLDLLCALSAAAIVSGCANPLAEALKAQQMTAVSPILTLTRSDSSEIELGGTIDCDLVSVGGEYDIALTLSNTGKTALVIDVPAMALAMGSGTEAGTYHVVGEPSPRIAIAESSTIALRFRPASAGVKTATFSIPTNDVTQPTFSITVSGTGWAVRLTTNDVSVGSISTTSATGGGVITDEGGIPVSARGVCWGTSPNPTIADSKNVIGAGAGSFSGIMAGLSTGTLYYARAYASNGLATGYGSQVSFFTLPLAPSAPLAATVRAPAGSGKLDVAWAAVSGTSILYDVYCDTVNSKPATAYATFTDLPATSCTLTGLTDYASYYVWVVAKTVTGSGTPSAASSPAMVGVKVASIALSASSVKLWPGYSQIVSVSYEPADATRPSVTWASSASARVSVSGGTVTGVGGELANPAASIGSSTITATPADGQGAASRTLVATNTAYAAGSAGPAAGLLFYDSGSYGSKGWRYMEAATANLSGRPWRIGGMAVIGGALNAYIIGAGKTNTAAIVDALGSGSYMAYDCGTYSLGGYADWFMPSMDEVSALRAAIPSVMNYAAYEEFYSSTQSSSYTCKVYRFYEATSEWTWRDAYTNAVGSLYITRPVRQF